MSIKKRIIIAGLDGVPFGMLEDFARSGVMPNTARLIEQGIFRKTNSTVPEVSSVAWSSIITGKNPAEHGIFGFTDLMPDSYQLTFPNFTKLKAAPFWQTWPVRSAILNVPSTYPVTEMNGAHISGFVSIDFEKSVHPKSLVPELKQLDYRLDVDSQKAHQDMELFIDDLDKTLDARIAAYRYLWQSEKWDVFMPVFTGTDRLMHFLFEAYADKSHKYANVFEEHFNKIDVFLGEIHNQAGDDAIFVVLSDHGFELLETEVHINYLLMQQGLLQFQQGTDPDLKNICLAAKTFAMDPARIYVNKKGKYPQGSVEEHDVPAVLDELENLFGSFEIDGKKVIRDIYRKEQIYHGPYLQDAPDMVLVANAGFDLKAKLRVDKLFAKGIFSGKHTQDTAFLIVKGLDNKALVPDVPTVWDITSIIAGDLGLA